MGAACSRKQEPRGQERAKRNAFVRAEPGHSCFTPGFAALLEATPEIEARLGEQASAYHRREHQRRYGNPFAIIAIRNRQRVFRYPF
jgi:hypothetical protein